MDNCCVCFNDNANMVKINEKTLKNDTSIKSQLELLVPEVIWLECYVICCKCQDSLNLVQEFRQQCLKSQMLREVDIKEEEPSLTDFPSPETVLEPLNSDKLLLEDPLEDTTTLIDTKKSKLPKSNRSVLDPSQQPPIKRTKMCVYCGKAFKTKTDLNVHEKIHLNKREYECKKCKKRFNTSRNLHSHNFTKHTDPIKWHYYCELCDKRFPMKGTYDKHVKNHQNIKDFKCHLCSKEFTCNTALKLHLTVHSNFKEFKCDICNREFNLKKSLQGHKFRKHQSGNVKLPVKERKYVCEICGKAFAMLIVLKNHLYVHADEQQFKCDLCGTKFKHKRSVKPHMIKYHQISGDDEK